MAKRTRIIEGTWNCTSCDTRDIPARFRKCPTCNNPREESGRESEFDFGEVDAASGRLKREGTQDEKAVSAAGAGADWFCEYCQASNRGDTTVCHHCRAERSSASRALSEEELRAAAPPPAARKRSLPRWLLYAGVGVFVLFGSCVGLAIWGSITHDYPGRVVSTEWTHTVRRQSFQRVKLEGWRDELRAASARMPVNGQGEVAGVENIRDCVSRQRGTRQVAIGTREVCSNKTRSVACGTEEKCTTKKLGNGYAQETCHDVTKYCDETYRDCHDETQYRTEPVFAQKCAYDTYQWKQVDERKLSGHEDAPRWPELQAGSLDRLEREAKYRVQVEYTDGATKTHVVEPKTEAEFLTWKKGTPLSLKVSNSGKVEQVTPGGGKSQGGREETGR
ncbi:hypothetical protein F0U62_04300 [Cystobacter fuscus]|uniref:hypothetical protein n=1 Tax=Cystobacter fuscus TaxID=43 RepID=UPI002B2EDBC7|nr:hypothetical protein F0U62_04300 [Cystobacter fuscus]